MVLDQASKLWALYGFGIEQHIAAHGPIPVTSFFDIVLVWNRGISYGLFQQDSDLGRYMLIGFAVLASLFIAVWLWRNKQRHIGFALGLVLGGAIANGIDRVLHGAVVDLFHFHWGEFSWYVFNLADVWIVAGAAILVYDSVFGKDDQNEDNGPNDAAKA